MCCTVAHDVHSLETKWRASCCTAPIHDPAYCFLVSAVGCEALLLIMLPVSAGSRPATGHADVVVDNWTLSTVEDYEYVVILSRWRPALGDCTLHLRKGRREGLTVGCLITLSYRAQYILTASSYHKAEIHQKNTHVLVWCYLHFLFLIHLVTIFLWTTVVYLKALFVPFNSRICSLIISWMKRKNHRDITNLLHPF